MECICVTCPCCYGLVCVVCITCLSSVVSWAPTWDYHCILLVQGALFSVPDVWVCWAVLVCWCHHKCFHLALTEWSECPTPCCLLWPPWCGEVPHSKIWSAQVWQGQWWQNLSGLGHWKREAQSGGISPTRGWICWPTLTAESEPHPLCSAGVFSSHIHTVPPNIIRSRVGCWCVMFFVCCQCTPYHFSPSLHMYTHCLV